MKKWAVLLVLVAIGVLLCFVDLNAAYTSDLTNAQQTVATGHGSTAPVGSRLIVYLAGDPTLARALKAQLPAAVRAKELPFAEIRFVDGLPADAYADPFLSIVPADAAGFWSPVYARGSMAVTIHYVQGRPVDPAKVLALDPPGQTTAMSPDTCRGECTEGMRTLKLNTLGVGLVSLPHMRTAAATKIAAEAATLVAAGLPANLDPARWHERAATLAHQLLGDHPGGVATAFVRQAGCRGGVAAVTGVGDQSDWRLMYYDAERDAITEVVTRSDLQAKLPGVNPVASPAFGSGPEGLGLYVGGDKSLLLPAGQCGLSGLQAR